MQAATAPSSLVSSSVFSAPRHGFLAPISRGMNCKRRNSSSARVSCEAAAISTTSALDASAPEEASRVGARVRVKTSVKIFHVQKVGELELQGMEGVVKQYVGFWKGKFISANLPFKIEFLLPDGVEGKPGPIKFVAHLREDEFEYLSQD